MQRLILYTQSPLEAWVRFFTQRLNVNAQRCIHCCTCMYSRNNKIKQRSPQCIGGLENTEVALKQHQQPQVASSCEISEEEKVVKTCLKYIIIIFETRRSEMSLPCAMGELLFGGI